jgi:hypothetical protein
MTKVIISRSLLHYQHSMASAVDQVRREWNIAGLQPCGFQAPFRIPADAVSSEPGLAGLLQPPRIEIVIIDDLEVRDGCIDELIQFWTWGDFGPLDVSVNILDAKGELLEGDYAVPNETVLNHWMYIVEMEAGDHRSVTLQAIVTDRLGGMSMQTVSLPVYYPSSQT